MKRLERDGKGNKDRREKSRTVKAKNQSPSLNLTTYYSSKHLVFPASAFSSVKEEWQSALQRRCWGSKVQDDKEPYKLQLRRMNQVRPVLSREEAESKVLTYVNGTCFPICIYLLVKVARIPSLHFTFKCIVFPLGSHSKIVVLLGLHSSTCRKRTEPL